MGSGRVGRVGKVRVGWVVATAKRRSRMRQMTEFRVVIPSMCTYNESIFYFYKA